MRVISGSARGHKLKTPEGLDTRPTTDRIKETLFNIIAPDLIECRFLDLFSGTGGIGIEALSRGGDISVFVDNTQVCCDIIEENLKHTKLYDKAEIIKSDIFSAIDLLGKNNRVFDIIFIDPPYDGGFDTDVLNAIVKAKILDKNGYIILERATKYAAPNINGLTIIKEKEYGKLTVMTFFALEV